MDSDVPTTAQGQIKTSQVKRKFMDFNVPPTAQLFQDKWTIQVTLKFMDFKVPTTNPLFQDK